MPQMCCHLWKVQLLSAEKICWQHCSLLSSENPLRDRFYNSMPCHPLLMSSPTIFGINCSASSLFTLVYSLKKVWNEHNALFHFGNRITFETVSLPVLDATTFGQGLIQGISPFWSVLDKWYLLDNKAIYGGLNWLPWYSQKSGFKNM
jgi:hypothetical protein